MAAFTAVPDLGIATQDAILSAADRQQWIATAADAAATAQRHATQNSSAANLAYAKNVVQHMHNLGGMDKAKALELTAKLMPLFFIKQQMELPPACEKEARNRKMLANKDRWGEPNFGKYLHRGIQAYVDGQMQARMTEGDSINIIRMPKGTGACTECCCCLWADSALRILPHLRHHA